MVKSEIDEVTTYYPSAAYQVKTDGTYTNTRKYYAFNSAVVAMLAPYGSAPPGVLRYAPQKRRSDLAVAGSSQFHHHNCRCRWQLQSKKDKGVEAEALVDNPALFDRILP